MEKDKDTKQTEEQEVKQGDAQGKREEAAIPASGHSKESNKEGSR